MTWLYKTNTNNTARFTLGECNDALGKTLICVGINPSTATPNALDPTLKKVKNMATSNKYENWVMINVYPQRATKPNNLHITCNTQLHKENLNEIAGLLMAFKKSDILFAYGDLIYKRHYLQNCLNDILSTINSVGFTGKKLCIIRTKKGNPAHPLYQKNNSKFILY